MSIRALSPELAEKARQELNEDPKRISSDLQHIKDWVAKQPHLFARTDDQWLIAFLRGCKYSLERTKEKLDLYYSMRTVAPELFRIRHTDQIFQEILDMGIYVFLPNSSKGDAPCLSIIRPGNFSPEKYSVMDVFSSAMLLQKILLLDDDRTVVCGITTLIDMADISVGHLLQMTPSSIKKMVTLSQDALPIRIKGSHFINMPPGFETILNMIISLLNEKNRSRIHAYNKNNYEELFKHIPRKVLPAEYGGSAGTMREITDQWKPRIQELSSWLEEDLNYCSDESKRIGQPKTPESLFGVEGSFRRLELD